MNLVRTAALCLGIIANLAANGAAAEKAAPTGRDLKKVVEEYLALDVDDRLAMRESLDEQFQPIFASALKRTRDEMLKLSQRTGPRLETSGTNYFYDEKTKRGKYIVKGSPSKVLFIGLHGGGEGSGDAGSMAAGMGGGGFWWIFPEVLEKTERGWTDNGTEEFVLELVEAACRSGKVDPNRIYVTGHSMGGYGAWTLGAHHPDVFAGAAAYAGAPTVIYKSPGSGETYEAISAIVEGVLPNLYNSRLFVFQSTDDPRVPPGPNVFAIEKLSTWREKHPGGFDFRYEQVDDRQHSAPKEGYLKSQKWVAEHERIARPRKLIWQPVLAWKRQYHWLYWEKPEIYAVLIAEVKEANHVEISTEAGSGDVSGLSVLLGEPLIDLDEEVVVTVNGEEKFRGKVETTLSTLLMTLPRNDPELLFDARVDL